MTRLLYQDDAYLKSVTTEVVSCAETDAGFEALLGETVLYPEGGGQPSDRGSVGGQPVLGLEKCGADVVHLLEQPVAGQVEVALDWPRRHDHMQQHTAQHLITAVAQDRIGWTTCAFHLGERRSDIELDCPEVTPAALEQLEEQVNALIRADRVVTTRAAEADQLRRLGVRTRGLPDNLTGLVRLVEIAEVDLNTCGGTHVSRTAELQAVKLLGTEHMRGGTRLHYLAGRRVLSRLTSALAREGALADRLSCGPEDHAAAVDRLQHELRESERQRRALVGELARHLGRGLAAQSGPVASLHRPDGDMELLRGVASAVLDQPDSPYWVLLTAGGARGVFLLLGPEGRLAEVGPRVAAVLDGRGGGKGSMYQGKAGDLSRVDAAIAALEAL